MMEISLRYSKWELKGSLAPIAFTLWRFQRRMFSESLAFGAIPQRSRGPIGLGSSRSLT